MISLLLFLHVSLIAQDRVFLSVDAKIAGVSEVRYRGGLNSIGFWKSPDDVITWTTTIEEGGNYHIGLVVGCHPGNEGSEIEIRLGQERTAVVVPETGSWHNYETVWSSPIEVSAGLVTISLQAKNITKSAVGDLRSLLLSKEGPIGHEQSLPSDFESLDSTAQIEALIAAMTLSEKVEFCHGRRIALPSQINAPAFSGIERFGIPPMACGDGPRGIKYGEVAFPVGPGQSASWDVDLMHRVGAAVGESAKSWDIFVLLGPAFNILRDPLGGRWFEYYSEDPFLSGALAAPMVQGIQSTGVAACIKHFVCNNREDNREMYNSIVDERALREIYLPAFRMGVEAGAMTLMTGANWLNGSPISDNKHVMRDILKDEWGFQGFTMTDWCGTKSLGPAIVAGLDVSMPHGGRSSDFFGKDLLTAVKRGDVSESELDDRVRRVLRVHAFTGLLDGTASKDFSIDLPAHLALARSAAEDSMVLLKNESNILPLDRSATQRVLLLGPNLEQAFCRAGDGGSSSLQRATQHEISALEGIRNAAGQQVELDVFAMSDLLQSDFKVVEGDVLKGLIQARYYKDTDHWHARLDRKSFTLEERVPKIDFMWEMRSPDMDILGTDRFAAIYEGEFLPPVSGTYTFRVTADDDAYLMVEGNMMMRSSNQESYVIVDLLAGESVSFELGMYEREGDASVRFEYALPMDEHTFAKSMQELDRRAQQSDAVVFVGGVNHGYETEGRDRSHMDFPQLQTRLIKALGQMNSQTVVVLYNGAPFIVEPWLASAAAVLEAWYPGVEGGNAIGRILFGDVNPSGKLPFTWPNSLEETPAHAVGSQTRDRIDYKEGIYVGYRYYDQQQLKPEFPFGYGMSYTTFSYDKISIQKSGDSQYPLTAAVTLTNTGKVAGREVVQVYVSDVDSSVDQPVKELAGFTKIGLKPGESKTVEVPLHWTAFQFFDVAADCWQLEHGEFIIRSGGASDSLPVERSIKL
ncbi:glycoside hydrolase family 3 C-terminal domain-containing protein [Coraliomargarita sp. W4R72]